MELKLTCKFGPDSAIWEDRPEHLTSVKDLDGLETHDEINQQEMEFPK